MRTEKIAFAIATLALNDSTRKCRQNLVFLPHLSIQLNSCLGNTC